MSTVCQFHLRECVSISVGDFFFFLLLFFFFPFLSSLGFGFCPLFFTPYFFIFLNCFTYGFLVLVCVMFIHRITWGVIREYPSQNLL